MNNEFLRKLLLLAAQFDVACDSAERLYRRHETILRVVGVDAGNVLYGIVKEAGHNPKFGSSLIFDILVDSAESVFANGGETPDAVKAIWNTIWKYDAELNKSILPLLPMMNDVNPSTVMRTLCAVNLTEMTYIARCFYLWSLLELSETDQVLLK